MKTILIVEDESAYSNILRDQLIKSGYKVIEAKDGIEGLALAKRDHPDLILLDIIMPEMNGLTMLDTLRKDTYGKKVVVIVLTNIEPDSRTLQEIINNRPSFYLIKSDILISDLLKKIKEVLSSPGVL